MQLRSANEFHKLLLALKEESQKTAAGWNVRALTSQSKPKKEKLNVRAWLLRSDESNMSPHDRRYHRCVAQSQEFGEARVFSFLQALKTSGWPQQR